MVYKLITPITPSTTSTSTLIDCFEEAKDVFWKEFVCVYLKEQQKSESTSNSQQTILRLTENDNVVFDYTKIIKYKKRIPPQLFLRICDRVIYDFNKKTPLCFTSMLVRELEILKLSYKDNQNLDDVVDHDLILRFKQEDNELAMIFKNNRLFHGLSRDGHIVHYHDYGKNLDFDKLLEFEMSKIQEYFWKLFEIESRIMEKLGPGMVVNPRRSIHIIDVNRLPMYVVVKKKYKDFIVEMITLQLSNPLGSVEKVWIINASATFKILWKIIRLFIPKEYLEDIKVTSTNGHKYYSSDIPDHNIPKIYDGGCDCESNECGDVLTKIETIG